MAKRLEMAGPIGEGIRILDEQKPAAYFYTHELGRRLKPEHLGPWGKLLTYIGDTALEARLDFTVKIPTRAKDLRLTLVQAEQLNAAANKLESLRDGLDTVLKLPITGKKEDLELTFLGFVLGRARSVARLYANFSSGAMLATREEIGNCLGLIPGVPPYSAHAPDNPSHGVITLGRFNKIVPPDIEDKLLHPIGIEGLPVIGDTVSLGPIENIPLTTMRNRVIRPDL